MLSFSIADNLVLTSYHRQPYSRGLLRNDAAIHEAAEEQIKAFDIRTPSADAKASTLSGGNQQKVVIAREFSRDLRLLVLDQPTRGLDVGSIEFIHKQTIAKRDAGTAILLVSAELDEILELSDRIAVIYRGRLVGLRDGRTADKNDVGLLMATGGRPSDGRDGSASRAEAPGARHERPAEPRLGDPRPAGHLDRPVGPRRLAGHHLLAVAGRRQSCNPGLALDAYGALVSGSVGSERAIVNTLEQHDAAAARRPGGRPRVQGRTVQHRRAGPVPDGRPGLGHRRRPARARARRSSRSRVSLAAGHDLRGCLGLHPGLPEGRLGRA